MLSALKAVGIFCGCLHEGEENEEKKKELRSAYTTEAHQMDEKTLEKEFNTSIKEGLTREAYKAALLKYGKNMLTPKKKMPPWLKFIQMTFTGFFNLLLWAGSILCLVAWDIDPSGDQSNLYLGIVLMIVVLLTGAFSFYQESRSAAIMEGFKKLMPAKVVVLRESGDGKVKPASKPGESLVPGDLIQLKMGDKIPADIRIVSCTNDTQVDNSSLTGESEPQDRATVCSSDIPQETKNLAFFGTKLLRGACSGIVINTADRTMMGRIASLADSTATVDTPIRREIEHFIRIISAIAITQGIICFIIGAILKLDTISNFIFAIGIIVANVPEGLLATVTVSLALTAKRMASQNVLVKNLEAVETLGSTTCICSDKTGTLTTNVMTVAHVYYNFKIFECDTAEPLKGEFDTQSVGFKNLTRIACLCNNADYETMNAKTLTMTLTLREGNALANLVKNKDMLAEAKRILKGDASEQGITRFIEPHFGSGFSKFREGYPKIWGIPFNSGNKWQLSVHHAFQEGGSDSVKSQHFLVMKGAPDVVLKYCDSYEVDGEVFPMDAKAKEKIEDGVRSLGDMGERVLGFCHLMLDAQTFNQNYTYAGTKHTDVNLPLLQPGSQNRGITFVGLMAMIDPPRPGVPQAVARCRSAGIKVIMVTGDHPITATAIAKKVGIINNDTEDDLIRKKGMKKEDIDDSKVLASVTEGQELTRQLNQPLDDQIKFWNRVLNKPDCVFARTSPQQKLLIVEACQARGAVVAVTGDGVNDAPALKKSDIGVAMGIAGTDVAKDSADMLLLDDNFASIVHGVEAGRVIFDNLKNSIAYTLTSNIPELLPFVAYVFAAIPLPLTVVLILCVDLGTDMIPAISFAHEKGDADIMTRPPRNAATDRLVTPRLISFAYGQIGMIQAMAAFSTFFIVMADLGVPWYILPGTRDSWGKEDFWCTPGTWDNCEFSNLPLGDKALAINKNDQSIALQTAQTACLCAIVMCQWANVIMCRTRFVPSWTKPLENPMMILGLVTETLLVCLISYAPFMNTIFSTQPMKFVHWLPSIPFVLLQYVYEETRKSLVRKNKTGWLARHTIF